MNRFQVQGVMLGDEKVSCEIPSEPNGMEKHILQKD